MKLAITAILLLHALGSNAASYTLTDGTYESQAPALVNGDIIKIPAGVVVTTTSVLTLPDITFNIAGTFTFQNASPKPKWTLGSGSIINVYSGGTINSSAVSPAIQLTIGSNVVYNGGNPPVTGPATATSSSSTFQSNTSLPLKLVNFSVAVINNEARLKWTAINDNIAAAFHIERSASGKEWISVGHIQTEGNASLTDYSFTDNSRQFNAAYYRLAYDNGSGLTVYSSVLKADFIKNSQPVVLVKNDAVDITFKNSDSHLRTVTITDLSGNQHYQVDTRSTNFSLPLADVSGLQIIRIFEEGQLIYSNKMLH